MSEREQQAAFLVSTVVEHRPIEMVDRNLPHVSAASSSMNTLSIGILRATGSFALARMSSEAGFAAMLLAAVSIQLFEKLYQSSLGRGLAAWKPSDGMPENYDSGKGELPVYGALLKRKKGGSA